MDKLEYYYQFKKFQQNREKHFSPSIARSIKKQYDDFLIALKYNKTNPLQAISSQPIKDTLLPLYKDALVYAAKVRAYLVSQKARMPIGFNEYIVREMLNYFETDILNVSEDITQTTREIIQKVLSDATVYGWGFDEIVSRLNIAPISVSRGRLIARTETVTAANQAGRFAAQQSGLLLQKEWLSASDNRVRKDHILVNGQIVAMDSYFSLSGGITMLQPGARTQQNGLSVPAKEVVNCRCTTIYLPQRGGNGRVLTV